MSPAAERDQTLEQLEALRTEARALQEKLATLLGKMDRLWAAEDDRVLALIHQRNSAQADLEQAERSVCNVLLAGAELALSHLIDVNGELDFAELEPLGDDLYGLHAAHCPSYCEMGCGGFIVKLGPADHEDARHGGRPVLEVHYGTLKAVRP